MSVCGCVPGFVLVLRSVHCVSGYDQKSGLCRIYRKLGSQGLWLVQSLSSSPASATRSPGRSTSTFLPLFSGRDPGRGSIPSSQTAVDDVTYDTSNAHRVKSLVSRSPAPAQAIDQLSICLCSALTTSICNSLPTCSLSLALNPRSSSS